MITNELEPWVDITVVGHKVFLGLSNLKGREVLKILRIAKKLGRIPNLASIILECQRHPDSIVNYSYCG